jgi:hypothetical protein
MRNNLQSTSRAIPFVLAAIVSTLAGCDLLAGHAQDLDNDRCERRAMTYDDHKACQARSKSFANDEKRRKQDDELHLGPAKPAKPAG